MLGIDSKYNKKMAQKNKINLEKFNDIEMISSNDENAVYRVLVSPNSLKNLTLEEKQKLRRSIINTTVQFFDVEDLNRLKKIEDNIHSNFKDERQKKSLFSFLYNFLEI